MPEQTPAAPQHVHHADLNYQLPAEAAPKLEMVPSPNGDGSIAAWRDGYQTKQFPGPRIHQRVHVFDDVESFADYLNRHAAPLGLQVEILMSADGRITAALDPSRTNGDLIACDLVPHPRFMAWHRWLEGEARGPRERLTQREFFALLRARSGDVVTFVPEAVPQEPLVGPSMGQQLLAAVQSLRLTKDGSRQVDIDQHGYTRFSGGDDRRQVVGSFPPAFWLDVPVFDAVYAAPVTRVARTDGEPLDMTPGAIAVLPEGVRLDRRTAIRGELRSYRFEVLLWLEVDGPEPMFQLQAPELDLVMRQARRDAADYLGSLLDEPLMVGLGALGLSNVPASGICPGGEPSATYYAPLKRGGPAR